MMDHFELKAFNEFILNEAYAIFEASTLSKTGIPKEMVSAIHQKEEHKSEKYKELGYVHMGGRPVTLPYTYFKPSHDIEVPTPITFTGRKVEPPAGVDRTAWYTDFAQYLQDLPNGPISVLLTMPDHEMYLYLYYKQKWGGGPNEGGQQYAIIAWDKDKKEAVDMHFVGLTTEGVEKRLVRSVHKTKGGNTNAKVQEFINTLGGGAPRRNNPVYAYELDVTQAPREKAGVRKSATSLTSMDLLRVFANKYQKILKGIDPKYTSKFKQEISAAYSISGPTPPQEIVEFANSIGADPRETLAWLWQSMKAFRNEMFKQSQGGYSKASGFDLEEENQVAQQYVIPNGAYPIKTVEDPKDYRISSLERRARTVGPEKIKRKLPLSGEYASIPSMVKFHGAEGTLHKFMFYLMTDKIDSPRVNVLSLLGIDPDSELLRGLPDFEDWTV